MARALLLDAARTPFGSYRGGLCGLRVDDLAAMPIAELLRRHGPAGSGALDPERIDDIYYGNANGAGEESGNVARMAGLLAGLPVTVPGITVNRHCASGGDALVQAARAVRAEDAGVVIAGGVEGMSRAPFVVARAERALDDRLDVMPTTREWRLANPRMPTEWTIAMGRAAEKTALELDITRTEMDGYALRSHRRAAASWDAGVHDGFVFPINTPESGLVRRDESIRPTTSEATLARLPSCFSPDGPVTEGNAAPPGDGALAVLIGGEEDARRLEIEPLGEVLGNAVVASEPDRFALTPIPAIHQLLRRLGVGPTEVDLWEINEAFAAVVLSTLRRLPDVDRQLVNVHGGAIAYGNPLGATMSRIVVDLCRHLRHRGGGLGVAATSAHAGQAVAIAVRVDHGAVSAMPGQ